MRVQRLREKTTGYLIVPRDCWLNDPAYDLVWAETGQEYQAVPSYVSAASDASEELTIEAPTRKSKAQKKATLDLSEFVNAADLSAGIDNGPSD